MPYRPAMAKTTNTFPPARNADFSPRRFPLTDIDALRAIQQRQALKVERNTVATASIALATLAGGAVTHFGLSGDLPGLALGALGTLAAAYGAGEAVRFWFKQPIAACHWNAQRAAAHYHLKTGANLDLDRLATHAFDRAVPPAVRPALRVVGQAYDAYLGD